MGDMDREQIKNIFDKYFCIFCSGEFGSIGEAYEHYKRHMRNRIFCKSCDGSLSSKKPLELINDEVKEEEDGKGDDHGEEVNIKVEESNGNIEENSETEGNDAKRNGNVDDESEDDKGENFKCKNEENNKNLNCEEENVRVKSEEDKTDDTLEEKENYVEGETTIKNEMEIDGNDIKAENEEDEEECKKIENEMGCSIHASIIGPDSESELTMIEMWIERFLTYQEDLINKERSSIITSNKFFLGCPVCDSLIQRCNVTVPEEAKTKWDSYQEEEVLKKEENGDKSGMWSANKEAGKCHTVRHACSHLRYYPYECLACEKSGRYQKKPDLSEMVRHVKDNHGRNLKGEDLESVIKHVTINKLEMFMEDYLRGRPMIRFDPIIDFEMASAPRLRTRRSTGPRSSISPILPLDLTGMETSGKKDQVTNSLLSGNGNMDNSLISRVNNNRYSTSFGNEGNSKTSAESSRNAFQRQFGNIFDDEDMIKFPMNQEEDVNAEYFCIFCDEKFKVKDEARRHYQKHVNYYPLMCSLCGEGATDIQEFLKHHTEVHPEASKGRYKRREQTVIEKWISGFLYAQATVIRAFPPREQCPVCEKVFAPSEISACRPRRCTVNRKIDHVHRHLCYLPYECLKCKEEGKEFLVAYFESKAHSHIKLKHPEIDGTESRWFVFQRSISIPKLDEYIANFFTRYGISMDYERRPIRKQGGLGFNSGISGLFNISSTPILISSCPQTPETEEPSLPFPSDSVIIVDEEDEEDESEMIIPVSPNHADMVRSMIPNGALAHLFASDYFCIFCPARFRNKAEAYPHYGNHLNYKPVRCLICDLRFDDVQALTNHHTIHHPGQVDLMHEIQEDEELEVWVDDFLEFQSRTESKRLSRNCTCASACPVCDRLRSIHQGGVSLCTQHGEVEFGSHLHAHLRYYPVECNLCRRYGRISRLPSLESSQLEHIRSHHPIPESTLNKVGKYFRRVINIPGVDQLILELIGKRRNLERSLHRPDLNLTNGRAIAHVRVEGGRVVNLPSSLSLRAIQNQKMTVDLKAYKNLLRGTNRAVTESRFGGGISGMMSSGIIKCLHCQLALPGGRKELKLHHQQCHPGLSLACLTAPRSSFNPM